MEDWATSARQGGEKNQNIYTNVNNETFRLQKSTWMISQSLKRKMYHQSAVSVCTMLPWQQANRNSRLTEKQRMATCWSGLVSYWRQVLTQILPPDRIPERTGGNVRAQGGRTSAASTRTTRVCVCVWKQAHAAAGSSLLIWLNIHHLQVRRQQQVPGEQQAAKQSGAA